MIEKFLNLMRQQAGYMTSGQANTVLGQLINYDPDTFYGQVELYAADSNDPSSQPLTTGWLPIAVPSIGFYPAPNISDLVLVHFQEGNLQNGFISLSVYNGQVTQNPKAGEWYYVHSTGSFIKFTNDGKVSLNGNVEIDITAPTINITVSGTATVNATTIDLNAATVNMGNISGSLQPLLNSIARGVYNGHTHDIIGGGITDVPNQQITSSSVTTNVKAT